MAECTVAGLLAIRGYHAANGESGRDVCLIPESAHGTNAASAVLAGLRVVVVKCGGDGAIDLTDLAAKLAAHDGHVGAIMVTYPSTSGVYEETITTVADLVHEAGGQVYIDGANLNALAGLASPALLGGDVSHLNLHKTFCIPHGGGGPGVGPVAARAHLAPFLPGASQGGPVTAARAPAGGSAAAVSISDQTALPASSGWALGALAGGAGAGADSLSAVSGATVGSLRELNQFQKAFTPLSNSWRRVASAAASASEASPPRRPKDAIVVPGTMGTVSRRRQPANCMAGAAAPRHAMQRRRCADDFRPPRPRAPEALA